MRDLNTAALYVAVMYEGPWEKIMCWSMGIDRKTCELKFEMDPSRLLHRLRDRLGDFSERRDVAWRRRWAARDRMPPARWKRERHHDRH
jgi:hypothetical protein